MPAGHSDHLRTATLRPIESVFATVRHRMVRTEGALSPNAAKLMVFKRVMAAAWRASAISAASTVTHPLNRLVSIRGASLECPAYRFRHAECSGTHHRQAQTRTDEAMHVSGPGR